MRRWRTLIPAAVLLAAAAASIPIIGAASAQDDHSLTAVAAAATARFHNLNAAKAAGWNTEVVDLAGLSCIQDPTAGGMGVHWANTSLLGDATTDPSRPEALVYAPNADGQPKLAALEYIIFQQPWLDAHPTQLGDPPPPPPSLFGRDFALTPDPNRFGLPAFYSLHVWIWSPNPSGLFEPWNPRVHCP
jgi:hypothetical protein